MDGIMFKVRDEGKVINKTVYICIGLNRAGKKEVLGLWVGKAEREKMMQDALKPENRDKLLKAMEQMKKSGMISESQIQKAKEKLGL
jgi:transposase-like protein